MKRTELFTLSLGLLLLGTVGTARAQMMGRGMGTMMPGQGPMMGMMHHGGAMMENGGHLLMLLKRAQMTAPEDLRPRIQEMEDRYYDRILRHRAEIQIAKHRLHRLFQDPKATEKDLKKARKTLMEAKQALGQLCFQGMLELRSLLGPEAFARLFEMGMGPMGRMGPMGMGSGMEGIQ